jgi:N4-gp56 family major capsid protein
MATNGTSDRSNSIQTLLTTELVMEASRKQVWGQFPKIAPEGELSGARKGSTIDIRFQQRIPINTDTINEKADITPRVVNDNKTTISIDEYGDAVQIARFLELVQMGDARSEIGKAIADQQVGSLDRLAGRQYYEGNTIVLRANQNSTRAGLDATNDTLKSSGVGWNPIVQAQSMLRGAGAPGFSTDSGGQEKYATVIHESVAADVPEIAGYLPALQYGGKMTLFNGELAEVRGLRITTSAQGKVYPGAGATAQATTTLSASAAKGAATIAVASATGIAVGDFITLGTVEDGSTVTTENATAAVSRLETVLVISVSGTDIGVAGMGYASGAAQTPGLRYDHPSGEPVTEAAQVAAIPIFGPQSVMKAYAVPEGPFGHAVVSGPYDTLQRFHNVGWYFVGGWAKTMGLWTARLEVACAAPTIVINE